MTRKIAIYGGSFNPPTNGHKEVIKKLSNFEEIILVPSYKHAWGKQVISFHQRVEMLELFVDLNRILFWILKAALLTYLLKPTRANVLI